ncbi:hypothetical protein VSR69_21815 [Paraburkholderia phytofirmans]|uniref:hypothetical protein n=1 Tax=Paraburkholderia sp. BL9I2N2 TaxID=1938809 RepID=UPI001054025D|nr:hypothetical protein [Paraburkholderia sp. BL9I2N2]
MSNLDEPLVERHPQRQQPRSGLRSDLLFRPLFIRIFDDKGDLHALLRGNLTEHVIHPGRQRNVVDENPDLYLVHR